MVYVYVTWCWTRQLCSEFSDYNNFQNWRQPIARFQLAANSQTFVQLEMNRFVQVRTTERLMAPGQWNFGPVSLWSLSIEKPLGPNSYHIDIVFDAFKTVDWWVGDILLDYAYLDIFWYTMVHLVVFQNESVANGRSINSDALLGDGAAQEVLDEAKSAEDVDTGSVVVFRCAICMGKYPYGSSCTPKISHKYTFWDNTSVINPQFLWSLILRNSHFPRSRFSPNIWGFQIFKLQRDQL